MITARIWWRAIFRENVLRLCWANLAHFLAQGCEAITPVSWFFDALLDHSGMSFWFHRHTHISQQTQLLWAQRTSIRPYKSTTAMLYPWSRLPLLSQPPDGQTNWLTASRHAQRWYLPTLIYGLHVKSLVKVGDPYLGRPTHRHVSITKNTSIWNLKVCHYSEIDRFILLIPDKISVYSNNNSNISNNNNNHWLSLAWKHIDNLDTISTRDPQQMK